MLDRHKLLWASTATGVVFWLIETAIHTGVFADGTGWMSNLLPLTSNEWWMRLLVVFLIVGFGFYADRANSTLRRTEEGRRVAQARLDDALTRALSDFLPICGHCKAIREGERWFPVETYITGRTKTRFSHGLCPQCLPLYDEAG